MTQALTILACVAVCGCASVDRRHTMEVSVADQKMVLTDRGRIVAVYPVSTSKFGEGGGWGSNTTPLGRHRVARKLGGGLPAGAVLKSRRFTGEILEPNAPGRDPVVTRVLWLDGVESHNRDSLSRHIYIHGTTEERKVGERASYGCIRMRSSDVVDLYSRVGVGARVDIFTEPLSPRVRVPGATGKP